MKLERTPPRRLYPFVLYGAATLAVLAPVLPDPLGRALGHPWGDVYQHLWARWWPGYAISTGQSPGFTGLLNFPEGGRFYPIDLLGALACLPLGRAGPAAAALAHNLLAALNLALGGWAAGLLAARVARSRPAGLVAGAAYGFSPLALSSHHNGVTEMTWLAALPLALLALLRVLDRPAPGRVAGAALALALAALSSWYLALVTALFAMVLLALARPRRRPGAPGAHRTGGLKGALAALALAGLVVLPAALAFGSYLQDPRALVSPVQARAERPMETRIQPALREYVDPTSPTFLPAPYHHSVYPGWAVLLLAAAGLLRPSGAKSIPCPAGRPRASGARRGSGAWAAAAVLFGVLSVGPYLPPWSPQGPVHPVQPLVPLPLAWLAAVLPPLQALNFPYRLEVGAQLGLAVLAALALARPLARRRRFAWPAAAALAALVLAESLLLSPAPFPLAWAPVPRGDYGRLPEGAVVDLPLAAGGLDPAQAHGNLPPRLKSAWGRYMVAQIAHRHPLPLGIADRLPPVWTANPSLRALAALEPDLGLPAGGPPPDPADLSRAGFGAVVLHPGLRPNAATVHMVRTSLGPGQPAGTVLVYPIPAPGW